METQEKATFTIWHYDTQNGEERTLQAVRKTAKYFVLPDGKRVARRGKWHFRHDREDRISSFRRNIQCDEQEAGKYRKRAKRASDERSENTTWTWRGLASSTRYGSGKDCRPGAGGGERVAWPARFLPQGLTLVNDTPTNLREQTRAERVAQVDIRTGTQGSAQSAW